MKFKRIELEYIRKILEKYDYSNGVRKMNRFISELLNDADCDDEYDLINRDHYISYILWQRRDVEGALRNQNIAVTDENIQMVLDELYAEDMVSAQIGWDAINEAIRKAGLMELTEKK